MDLHTGIKCCKPISLIFQGKDPNIRQSCQPELTYKEWESHDILTLIQMELCPPYILPSTPLNGLCLPNYALASSAVESEKIATIMERIQVSNVEMMDFRTYVYSLLIVIAPWVPLLATR